jgi:1-acyl-sn-glycerol-3-phosphate acyltransferase
MREKLKCKNTLFYKLLFAYVKVAHRLYYRHFSVIGSENIPADTLVIFSPIHQNALMDALALIFATKRPVVFLAGAIKIKNAVILKMIKMLRIQTIYRIRDGIGMLGLNKEVFYNSVEELKSNNPVCIFPEGDHEGVKRLLPLKKGIFRISILAEKCTSYKLNLHIVPVGIEYSDYFTAGSDLTVVFGTPIKVSDYIDQYQENDSRIINAITHQLAINMQKVMIHIPEEHYELINQICEMLEPICLNPDDQDCHPYDKLTSKQSIIRKTSDAFLSNPEKANTISIALNSYIHNSEKSGIGDKILRNSPPEFIILLLETLLIVVTLPIYFFGFILNCIPYGISVWATRSIKNKHYKSSARFSINAFLFPVYYLIIFCAFCVLTNDFQLKLVFGITLPVSGFFVIYGLKYLQKFYRKLTLYIFMRFKNKSYSALVNERFQLIELLKITIGI